MSKRTFTEILQESRRTYQFKIGFAGELPEGFDGRLETALKRYSLVNMSTGKKTPIQERPLDFPQMSNCEVTYYDVEVEYPTTPQVLGNYLQNHCRMMPGTIVVRNPNDPLERYQTEEVKDVYEPILTQDDMGGASAQEDVGENRIMELLKELEQTRKERGASASDYAPDGKSMDISPEVNTKSIQGS